MTRTQFILSLPFIGAIGKLIAGEKKKEAWNSGTREIFSSIPMQGKMPVKGWIKTDRGNVPFREGDMLGVNATGIFINDKYVGKNPNSPSVRFNWY